MRLVGTSTAFKIRLCHYFVVLFVLLRTDNTAASHAICAPAKPSNKGKGLSFNTPNPIASIRMTASQRSSPERMNTPNSLRPSHSGWRKVVRSRHTINKLAISAVATP